LRLVYTSVDEYPTVVNTPSPKATSKKYAGANVEVVQVPEQVELAASHPLPEITHVPLPYATAKPPLLLAALQVNPS
jgi:hypothetical protein